MKCPECAQGKTGNCTGWILTPDDQIGTCETAEQNEGAPS